METTLRQALLECNPWALVLAASVLVVFTAAGAVMVGNLKNLRSGGGFSPSGAPPVFPAAGFTLRLVPPVLFAAAGVAALVLVPARLLLGGRVAAAGGDWVSSFALFQTIAAEAALAGAALYFLRRRAFGRRQLGLDRWRRHYLRVGARAYLSAVPVLALLGLLLGIFRRDMMPDQQVYQVLMDLSSPVHRLFFFVSIALLVPFLEEVFFRGFFYGALRNSLGVKPALFLSGLVFSVLHFSPAALAPIFFLGLVFGWLYEKTGSLWPAIVAHSLNNAVATAFVFLLRQVSPV